MDKLSANKLFKLVRELTGKTQPEVSAGAKITYQSLQQFEKGQASLSKETLKLMAKALYINPAYIDDTVSYPFKSNGRLIKMFMPDGVVFDNLEPFVNCRHKSSRGFRRNGASAKCSKNGLGYLFQNVIFTSFTG